VEREELLRMHGGESTLSHNLHKILRHITERDRKTFHVSALLPSVCVSQEAIKRNEKNAVDCERNVFTLSYWRILGAAS
jgi:hypothetical protein